MSTDTSSTGSRGAAPALVAGLAAALLATAAIVGTGGGAVAEEAERPHTAGEGVHAPSDGMRGEGMRGMAQERMAQRADRGAHREHAMDAEHLADLADQLGVDADELAALKETLRSESATDRDAMRDELADLDRDERRAAMQARAEERREAMADALAELGVDPAALAEHRAEHAQRGEHERHAGEDRPGPRTMRQGGMPGGA